MARKSLARAAAVRMCKWRKSLYDLVDVSLSANVKTIVIGEKIIAAQPTVVLT